jgi:hypothetical protein
VRERSPDQFLGSLHRATSMTQMSPTSSRQVK